MNSIIVYFILYMYSESICVCITKSEQHHATLATMAANQSTLSSYVVPKTKYKPDDKQ